MGNIYDLYSNALGRTYGNMGMGGGGMGAGVNMLTNMLPGGALLHALLAPALGQAGGLGGTLGGAGHWLSSLFGGSPGAGAGGFNPQQGMPMSYAPALGPGGTGAGTGSGVGPLLPTTANPSMQELTAVPEAGAPGAPSGVQVQPPMAAPSGAANPSGGFTPAEGGMGMSDLSAHRAAAQGQAAIDAMHQFVAQTMGLPPEAVSATIAALQRAAQYRQALLGS